LLLFAYLEQMKTYVYKVRNIPFCCTLAIVPSYKIL
jgi:hypothetical protein